MANRSYILPYCLRRYAILEARIAAWKKDFDSGEKRIANIVQWQSKRIIRGKMSVVEREKYSSRR